MLLLVRAVRWPTLLLASVRFRAAAMSLPGREGEFTDEGRCHPTVEAANVSDPAICRLTVRSSFLRRRPR
ncbi:protein of unknown function (plasmid) [Caballeronia sp. S22]